MRKNEKTKKCNDYKNYVAFGCLDITQINVPLQLHGRYKQYVNLLWKTNVIWGFQDLTTKERSILEQIDYEVVITSEMNQFLIFLADEAQITTDLKMKVQELCDASFAQRVKDCMYEDLGKENESSK